MQKIKKRFAKYWGFQHIPSSPEYPRSNGLTEKTEETEKNFVEKAKEDNNDPYLAMVEVRNTPVDTTNLQPNLLGKDNFNQFYQLVQTI